MWEGKKIAQLNTSVKMVSPPFSTKKKELITIQKKKFYFRFLVRKKKKDWLYKKNSRIPTAVPGSVCERIESVHARILSLSESIAVHEGRTVTVAHSAASAPVAAEPTAIVVSPSPTITP